MNSDERAFIKDFVIASPKHLQELHENWLKICTFPFQAKKKFEEMSVKPPKVFEMIECCIHNTEEEFHTSIENTAIKYVDLILQEDIGFYDLDKGCMEFFLFLSVQYMRTNKIKKSFLEIVKNFKAIEFGNVWNVLRHILATNIAWTLYEERKVFRIILLKNESSVEFLTGDQPVVNALASIGVSQAPPNELELYYPISPKLAILISKREELREIQVKLLNKNDVISYNNLIVKNAHSQIYATSIGILEKYNDLQKMKA